MLVFDLKELVETRRVELLTFGMQIQRSTS
jgi:hypothetical protein